MRTAAALGIFAALLLIGPAQAGGRSARTPYPELERGWKNPYAKRERSEWREPSEYRERREYEGSGGLRQGKGRSDITGFRREPLGGGSWMDRAH